MSTNSSQWDWFSYRAKKKMSWDLELNRDVICSFNRCWWVCRKHKSLWEWTMPQRPGCISLRVWDGLHSSLRQQILPRWVTRIPTHFQVGSTTTNETTKRAEQAPPGSRIHSTCCTHKSHLFKHGLFCRMNNDEGGFHLLWSFPGQEPRVGTLAYSFFFFFNYFFFYH